MLVLLLGFSLVHFIAAHSAEVRSADSRSAEVHAAAHSVEDDASEAEALAILNQYDKPTDTASQLRYLQSLLPDPNRKQRIADLIVELGDYGFEVRRYAYNQVLTIGVQARTQLVAATKSNDAEVRLRARQLLKSIESGADRRASLTRAALLLLRHRREAEAVPVALAVAARTDVTYIYDAACETVWASVIKTHADLLQEVIAGENIKSQAVAVVAIEVAIGEEAVKVVEPFLKSEHEGLRLAAARALVDRQPRVVAAVLIELLSSENPETCAQAQALLKMMFDQDLASDEEHSLAEAWRAWADRHLHVAPVAKLQLARLDLSHGRGFLEETFTIAAGDVTNGYGRFKYETDVQTKASVAKGVLRLEGDHAEADQRLCTTAEKLTGHREWPRIVEVNARLTGEDAGSGGYHVGLSVGRIKALFHPAYSGGGFRLETVDKHDYLVRNTNMGFTPRGNAMHDMTMTVTRTPAGAAIDIEVIQGDGPKTKFKRSYTVTKEQLGDFNRVGLERSGRTGGAAIFDRVSIRLKK